MQGDSQPFPSVSLIELSVKLEQINKTELLLLYVDRNIKLTDLLIVGWLLHLVQICLVC